MKLLWSFLPLPVFSITKHGLGLCDLEWNAFHLISNVCMWSLFKLSTAGANMTTLMMMIYIYILFPLWLLVLPSSTWILASLFSLQWWPSAIQFNFCLSLHFTVLFYSISRFCFTTWGTKRLSGPQLEWLLSAFVLHRSWFSDVCDVYSIVLMFWYTVKPLYSSHLKDLIQVFGNTLCVLHTQWQLNKLLNEIDSNSLTYLIFYFLLGNGILRGMVLALKNTIRGGVRENSSN